MYRGIHEECGVFGIRSNKTTNLASVVYHALYALQHRGQESCGIAINDGETIIGHKDLGLVSDVFTREVLEKLPEGHMAIGHCRYCAAEKNIANSALVIKHVKEYGGSS